MRPEDPRGPDHQTGFADGLNPGFSVGLRAPVDTQRIDRIRLAALAWGDAIEDVVGAHVDKSRPLLEGGLRHDLWGDRVDRKRLLLGVLTLVDARHRGRIDQQVIRLRTQQFAQRGSIGEVRISTRPPHHLVPEGTEVIDDGTAETAACSND